LEVIKRVDLLTINDEEAQQLSGIHNIHAAAKKILTMGPKFLIIKKGEHGAILYSADGPFAIPSYPVDSVCDPTGAGDTFAGGFMGYLDNEGSYDFAALKRSLAYATAMGSFNVEAFGPERLLELSAADISSRVDFLKAYTQF
jgi:sugar/nucleoside kinase (ribokinase family)